MTTQDLRDCLSFLFGFILIPTAIIITAMLA